MQPANRFSLRQRWRSFHFALQGLVVLVRDEHNARIHLAATGLCMLAMLLLPVSRHDVLLVLFAIALVWIAEAINTAVEALADTVDRKPNPGIKKAKDTAAAAVLIAAVLAVLVALGVFIPALWRLWNA